MNDHDAWSPESKFEVLPYLLFVQLKLSFKKHSMPTKSSKLKIRPFTVGPEETMSMRSDGTPFQPPLHAKSGKCRATLSVELAACLQ